MCLGELGENLVSQWILGNAWKWIEMVLWHFWDRARYSCTPHNRTPVVYYRLWRDTFVLLYLWIYTFEEEPAK